MGCDDRGTSRLLVWQNTLMSVHFFFTVCAPEPPWGRAAPAPSATASASTLRAAPPRCELRPRRCPALLAPAASHAWRLQCTVVPRSAGRRAAGLRSYGCALPSAQPARRPKRAACRAGRRRVRRVRAERQRAAPAEASRVRRARRSGAAHGPGPRLRRPTPKDEVASPMVATSRCALA